MIDDDVIVVRFEFGLNITISTVYFPVQLVRARFTLRSFGRRATVTGGCRPFSPPVPAFSFSIAHTTLSLSGNLRFF